MSSSPRGNGRKSPWSISSGTWSTVSRGASVDENEVVSVASSKTSGSAVPETSRSVKYGRLLFVVVLMSAAAILAWGAYRLMTNAYTQLASDRFYSIAERALSVAQYVIEEKKQATDALAFMLASAHSNASDWPTVSLAGYKEISSSLGMVTEGSLSFCPLVKPGGEEQSSFEEYAYELFAQQGYPDTTGVSDFGRGIFSFGSGEYGNETWSDGRFHITSGWTYHNSSREILVPLLQSDVGAHPALMLNMHYEHQRAAAIDDVMRCSEERKRAGDYRECGSVTDLMWTAAAEGDVDTGPVGLLMVPIYPLLDNTTITGFIVGKQIWADLLKHSFESSVNEVDVVLYTENEAHTYHVMAGEAIYVGRGKGYHDPNAQFQVTGTQINPRSFSNTSVEYYMDIFSTQEFVDSSVTFGNEDISNIPLVACIGTVFIMVFTSLLFILYDYFVRKEFDSKKKLLEAKRQFVRFISHEVRTPLNTVCMGLTLLEHDLSVVLGGQDQIRRSSSRKMMIERIDEEEEAESTPESMAKNFPPKQVSVAKKKVEEWMALSGQIFQNADAAVHVLSDLLNYDKIQMGTLSLELSLVNIWETLEKTANEFRLAAVENHVNFDLDMSRLLKADVDNTYSGRILGSEQFKGFPARHPTGSKKAVSITDLPLDLQHCRVIADEVRLAQVFRNLISNGMKFSKENGELTIRVYTKNLPKRKQKQEMVTLNVENEIAVTKIGTVVISVIDDGVGMTPEQVKTVFEDGTQFNANQYQSGGGSGLGLNIARGIVLEHGGELACSSSGMGKGTTFTLTLPLYSGSPSEMVLNDESTRAHLGDRAMYSPEAAIDDSLTQVECDGDPNFVLPELRVLVVDDSITNRKLCMRLLERNGHSTEGASDGKEAVEKVHKSLESKHFYDCILMDYEMPIMRGPEACKKMREMGCSSFIAGVTGNVMSDDVDHFRNCGANCVLPKPFRLEALEEHLIEHGVILSGKEIGDDVAKVESASSLVYIDDNVDFDISFQTSNAKG